jgi:hypothetical protein
MMLPHVVKNTIESCIIVNTLASDHCHTSQLLC